MVLVTVIWVLAPERCRQFIVQAERV